MRARLLSVLIHAGVIALLVVVSSHSVTKPYRGNFALLVNSTKTRLIAPRLLTGGGGGGGRDLLPASRGDLPKLARRQFVPPSATPPDFKPLLLMEATLVAPVEVRMPDPVLARIGDPFGRDGPASNGPGHNGGIGAGDSGGIGDRSGPGYGPHDGGGVDFSGGASGGVVAPVVLYKVDPEFSEEARKAKYQGTVVLTTEVGEDGKPRGFRILRSLGLGLDEKAIEAVSRWKFKPAMRNGKPVRAPATIEVNFRLL
jgi:TonB family protein